MRTMLKCIAIAGIWGFMQGVWLTNVQNEVSVNDILIRLAFGEVYFIPSYLMELGLMMLPYVIFQIIFGVFIYCHFCTASVFYFSRQAKRIYWFLKEAAVLYVYAILYVVSIFLFAIIGTALKGSLLFSTEALILMFSYIIIHSLWIFITTLIINLLSLFLGNNIGFVVVMIVQFSFVMMLFMFETICSLENVNTMQRNEVLLKLNPISHLVLKWHTSKCVEIDAYMHMLPISFDLYISIIVLLIAAVAVVLFGCLYVKKKEIITINMELEGV